MVYDNDRPEMVKLVPQSARRLLDVGCATGRFGDAVHAIDPTMELWGIDPTPPPRGRAQPYRSRIVGSFPDDIPPAERFDCVVFNDILEHLVDPWDALRQTHRFLTSAASVVLSIPNVRHIWVLRPLVFGGRWDYQDGGLLDRTHLRFFTRSTAIELLESTGYVVDHVKGIQWAGYGGRLTSANRLLRGRLDEFVTQQYAIVAHAADQQVGSRSALGGAEMPSEHSEQPDR